ncbi:CotY/CotZ family spore coat protein [Neobacillus mesonae]|uniref:Spore coat protein n=1 Tax=Neobacillus mesonae TaxID=1193713 RepID=A0A3Q9QW90_9BACI|nr:CotY/CotZ family spore coat protein [Neobacillus mesonae]AZU64748.1 hypothetical protein CHR53_27915 [Neobacillus mesonae]
MYKEYKDYGHNHVVESCEGQHDGDKKDSCVKEVLEAILKAQKKVSKMHREWKSSCNESINELLERHKRLKKNTIPFILYSGCGPFKGTGVTTLPGSPKKKKFVCVSSFIFRIKKLDDNCAVLELLVFKPRKSKSNAHKDCYPCSLIDLEFVEDLMKTGICIKVDLSSFCGITCLPAVYL